MGKFVAIGHSVVKATDYGGVTTATSFVQRIGLANGYAAADIINKGIGSDTSAGMLARFDTDVVAFAPDVVLIGPSLVNDWSGGVLTSTSKANLLAMHTKAKDAGIKVVFATDNIYRGTAAQFTSFYAYIEVVYEVAKITGCKVFDLYSIMCQRALVGDHLALFVDVVGHLTVAGQDFVTALAAKPYYAGMFVKDPVVVPVPGDTLPLVKAMADFLLGEFNASRTGSIAIERALV